VTAAIGFSVVLSKECLFSFLFVFVIRNGKYEKNEKRGGEDQGWSG
jgi:hypothetical protein